ncbi:hypothetical protein TNCV_3291791 [Trichonephila clavipes]|nr:hypothetical protein TNCV_3291791 [Trichonephila clavipes]
MARASQDGPRTVTIISWPARSPDLSPIEHIFDHLGWIDLRKMIMKFEETGELGVLPGRGRKLVGTDRVEIATTAVKSASSSIYFSASCRPVSRELEILRYILNGIRIRFT